MQLTSQPPPRPFGGRVIAEDEDEDAIDGDLHRRQFVDTTPYI